MESVQDIKTYLKSKAAAVDSHLDAYFNQSNIPSPAILLESMRYSLLAGGKRLRPVLAMASYEACGGQGVDIIASASALEVIHTYSLIHDDLPAMDNDDLRRGRPTNHKVYGDAMAILAGDGLLTEAFLMVMQTGKAVKSENLILACRELSIAAGPRGMVAGQAADMMAVEAKPDFETLKYIHSRKTGALITASVRLGGILYGADAKTMSALTRYGECIGLAFQIIDDILDVKGDQAVLGKPVGSDEGNKKMTYPSLFGLEESMRKAEEQMTMAIDALEAFPDSAWPLREMARYIVRRSH